MNAFHSTSVVRVRSEARNITGNNDKGGYSFWVVEILDSDDNKHEVTLPDKFDARTLTIGERYLVETVCTVRKGFLVIRVNSIEPAAAMPRPAAVKSA